MLNTVMHDAYGYFATTLTITALLISFVWAGIAIQSSKFFEASILFVVANLFIMMSAVTLTYFPSVLHYEYHDIDNDMGYVPILSNLLALIASSLFRWGKQNLVDPSVRVQDMIEYIGVPIVLIAVDVFAVRNGLDNSLFFELAFSLLFSYICYSIVLDTYENENTTILNKFVQSLPFKMLIVFQLRHLHLMLVNDDHATGGDELELIGEYVASLITINGSIMYQVRKILSPAHCRTKF